MASTLFLFGVSYFLYKSNQKYEQTNKEKLDNALHFYHQGKFEESVELLKELVDLKYPKSMIYLGLMHYDGKGVPQDSEKALFYFLSSAAHDESSAYYYLSKFYQETDKEKSRNYLEKGIELKDLKCLFQAGKECFDKSEWEKAKNYLTICADLYDSKSMYLLGQLYKNGWGVDQNIRKAKEYYQNAIDLGDEDSLLELVNILTQK